ncbi:hypothetical protein ACC680_31230, partial [Rhizobium ruizarguesonis]
IGPRPIKQSSGLFYDPNGTNPAPATKQIAAFRAAFCLVTGRGFNASSGACKKAKPTQRDRKLQSLKPTTKLPT